jgi:hypothetical protein
MLTLRQCSRRSVGGSSARCASWDLEAGIVLSHGYTGVRNLYLPDIAHTLPVNALNRPES